MVTEVLQLMFVGGLAGERLCFVVKSSDRTSDSRGATATVS
jgi:hypothetical protein